MKEDTVSQNSEKSSVENILDHLEQMEVDPVDKYLSELERAISQIDREAIWIATRMFMEAWKREAQIFLLGNGGSAATASHMANDLNKLTISPGRRRFKAIALSDNIPLITAWGNDSSYEDIFSEQMLNFLKPDDLVVAISTSGNSPNVLKAVNIANHFGAETIGITGDMGGKLKELVDLCLFVPTSHICQQEDCHLILEHTISTTLMRLIQKEE